MGQHAGSTGTSLPAATSASTCRANTYAMPSPSSAALAIATLVVTRVGDKPAGYRAPVLVEGTGSGVE